MDCALYKYSVFDKSMFFNEMWAHKSHIKRQDFPSNLARGILKHEEYTVGNVASTISISVVIDVLNWSNPDNKCIDFECCRSSFVCFHI